MAEREQGYVSSARLKALTDEAWGRWYEKSLSRYHPMFWAAKAHFSIAGFGFYNYPYLFGYLFSLGVYQQLISRQAAGEQEVAQAYRALLRDTGRMSAEELVMKHLGQDIREAAFWQGSLALVAAAVGSLRADPELRPGAGRAAPPALVGAWRPFPLPGAPKRGGETIFRRQGRDPKQESAMFWWRLGGSLG